MLQIIVLYLFFSDNISQDIRVVENCPVHEIDHILIVLNNLLRRHRSTMSTGNLAVNKETILSHV